MSAWSQRYLAVVGQLQRGRKSAGLSQVEAAEQLGISRRTFQRYEDGVLEPGAMTLFRWGDLVGVEIASNMTHRGA